MGVKNYETKPRSNCKRQIIVSSRVEGEVFDKEREKLSCTPKISYLKMQQKKYKIKQVPKNNSKKQTNKRKYQNYNFSFLTEDINIFFYFPIFQIKEAL